jgi:hypothetical protein
VVTGDYRDFFVGIAGAAGALTGLLFVALSVAPRRTPTLENPVVRQVRAGAALLAFTNALAVSLFGLVPETNAGYPALILGVIGILFAAAGTRSMLASLPTLRQRARQSGLLLLLLLIFGTELVCGILVVGDPGRATAMHLIGYALVTSIMVGVARAWEIVGDRDTGLFASLSTLAGRPGDEDRP